MCQYDAPLQRLARRTDTSTECWITTLGLTGAGYSQVWITDHPRRTVKLAHRIVYEHHFGPIPPGAVIDHTCHTRNCVRPDHLRVVTVRENLMADNSLAPARSNTQKTHCPRGHPYDEKNTYRDKRGFRYCRTCERAKSHRLQAAKRARLHPQRKAVSHHPN